MRNPAFKNKFVAYYLTGSLVSFVLVAFFLYAIVIPDIFNKEETAKQKTLEAVVNRVDSIVKRQTAEVEALRDTLSTFKTNYEIEQYLDNRVKSSSDFGGAYVFNQRYLSHGNFDLKKVGINPELLNKNKTTLFEVESNGIYKDNVYISAPAVLNGSNGYVIVQIKNQSLQRVLTFEESRASIAIYGNNNKAVVSTEKGILMSSSDLLTINAKYQALNNPIITYKDANGLSKVALVKNITPLGWTIVKVVPNKDFYYPSWATIYRILWAFGIYVFLSLVIILTSGSIILKPLSKLANGVHAVQNGDLTYKINFTSKDIFAEIADGFNKMVQKLKANYEELQKQAEELYERNWQVEEANKELEDSYEKLQDTINQLNDAEEKYYTLVKNIPEIVCVFEFDGTITFVNNYVYEALGYHKEELIGKNIDSIIDESVSKKFISIISRKLKKDNKIIHEIPMVRKDGKTIIAEVKLTYHMRNGSIDGVQAIVSDITKKKKMQNEIMQKNEEILTIYNISKSLSSTIELDNVFHLIVGEVCKILNAEACILRLFDTTGKHLIMKAYSGSFLDGMTDADLRDFSVLKLDKVSDVVKYRQIIQDTNLDPGWLFKHINEQRTESERINEVTLVPICAKDKVLGLITVGSRTKISDKRLSILSSIANNAAVAIENATLYENSKKYFIKTIDALIAAVEAKDKYTEGHSQRVAKYAEMIANALGLPKENIEDLKVAGILHDVGKIGISDTILLKPSPLTKAEYEEIKQHPIISNRILYSVGLSETTMRAIACHHERFDGKGYPFGLQGDELTIECQIIAVADSFDAMTSNRAYRQALSVEEAMAEIIKHRGTQFGPIVVDAMRNIYENDLETFMAVFKESGLAS